MQDELLFCPLGGSGEIGMNMNLFAYGKPDNQKWIMVDIGVTFADDSLPGIDLIYPDPGFIIDKKDDLLGIVLTHAHEDHIGAIVHIWPQIKCKIFSTPFTAVLIKEKFKEKRIDIGNNLKIFDLIHELAQENVNNEKRHFEIQLNDLLMATRAATDKKFQTIIERKVIQIQIPR